MHDRKCYRILGSIEKSGTLAWDGLAQSSQKDTAEPTIPSCWWLYLQRGTHCKIQSVCNNDFKVYLLYDF